MLKDIKSDKSEWEELKTKWGESSSVKQAINYLNNAYPHIQNAIKCIEDSNRKAFYDNLAPLECDITKAEIEILEEQRKKLYNFCSNIHGEIVDNIDVPFSEGIRAFSDAVFAIKPEEITNKKTGEAVGTDTLFSLLKDIQGTSALKADFEAKIKMLELDKEPSGDLKIALANAIAKERARQIKKIEMFLDKLKETPADNLERIVAISNHLQKLLVQIAPYMGINTSIESMKNIDFFKLAEVSAAHRNAIDKFIKDFEAKLKMVKAAEEIRAVAAIAAATSIDIASGGFGKDGYQLLIELELGTNLSKYNYIRLDSVGNISHIRNHDVGDGGITIGVGIYVKSTNASRIKMLEELGIKWNDTTQWVPIADVEKAFKNIASKYETTIKKAIDKNNLSVSQAQYDALFLLAYNRPALFNEGGAVNKLLSTNNDNKSDWRDAIISEYKTLNQWEKYGKGWSNRLEDTLELYFDEDYTRTH